MLPRLIFSIETTVVSRICGPGRIVLRSAFYILLPFSILARFPLIVIATCDVTVFVREYIVLTLCRGPCLSLITLGGGPVRISSAVFIAVVNIAARSINVGIPIHFVLDIGSVADIDVVANINVAGMDSYRAAVAAAVIATTAAPRMVASAITSAPDYADAKEPV